MNFATEQDPALATRLTKVVNKLRNSGAQVRTRLRRPCLFTETAWLYHPLIDLSPDFSSQHRVTVLFVGVPHCEQAAVSQM